MIFSRKSLKVAIEVTAVRGMALAITARNSNFTGGAFDLKFDDIEVIGG